MPPYDLQERTREFALRVVRFCRQLPKTDESREAASQLRRAANSVRSNYRAARNGRSRAEFTAKIGEVHEEADECRDHLQYSSDAGIRSDPILLQEATELTRIFASALRTARRNNDRIKDSVGRRELRPRKSDESAR
jgi:four helix bundle protein